MDLKAKYEREDNNNRMERTSIGGVLHSTSDGGPVISAKSLKGVTNVLGTRGYTNSNFTSVPTNSSVRPEKKRNVKLDAVHPVEISPLMSADRDRLDKKYSSYSNIEYEYPDTCSQSQLSDINISLVSAPLLRDGIECPSVDPDRAGTTHEADVNICTDTEAGYGGFNKAPLLDPALAKASKYKKTWDGVFLPVSISVFGVVLFIRLPWVIGQCGLYLTLGGIAISYITSGLTTISLAAISTNGFVGDGGPYMMISRCLGPQVGTVIGITFVIANLISSAMFLSGGSESFVTMFNWEQMIVWNRDHKYLTTVVISTIMLIILLLIALLSIEKPFRVICLILTLISLIDAAVCIPSAIYRGPNSEIGFTGWSSKTWYDNLYPDFDADAGFPTVLAVLFPGVTGVMSGVCLSGDLRSGAKAIPRGIGYAWVLSLVTYLAITVIISGSFERWALKEKLTIMSYVTHPYLFFPGEAVSSFAAVLAMVAGSSRVLQAMASDDLLNSRVLRFIGKSSKKSAIFCFALLVQCFILAGDIYTVASILATQAFCVNFMALNMSTFISAVSGVVSFRPIYSFFNHFTAFIGAAFCLGVMFYVNPIAAVAFNIVLISMFAFVDLYIDTSCLPYGDASQPLMFYMIRKWLLRLDERKEHIRHWRPSIIQVNTDPWCSLNLTHLCNNLKKGGIFEQAFVVKGDFSTTVKVCRRWKGWAMDYISASGIKAFALVGFGEDLRSGVQNLLRNLRTRRYAA